eukprot:132794_1
MISHRCLKFPRRCLLTETRRGAKKVPKWKESPVKIDSTHPHLPLPKTGTRFQHLTDKDRPETMMYEGELDTKMNHSEFDTKDMYWADHADGEDAYEDALDAHGKPSGRFNPLVLENAGNPYRYDRTLQGESMQPRVHLQPLETQRALYQMHKSDPEHWTPQRLSKHFAVHPVQVKRYIKNGEVEDSIRAKGGVVDDSLAKFVEEKFGVRKGRLIETRTFMNLVYDKYRQNFGHRHKSKLFRSLDDDDLAPDLGFRKPKLVPRKVPLNGPGSGRKIAAKKTDRTKHPLIISDVTNRQRYRRTDIVFPSKIRDTDGGMRQTTVPELRMIRNALLPVRHKPYFSPHDDREKIDMRGRMQPVSETERAD